MMFGLEASAFFDGEISIFKPIKSVPMATPVSQEIKQLGFSSRRS